MLRRQLFARKSLETLLAEMHGDNRLRRALGPVALTSLGVGAIIGAGIFVITGRTAAQDAGPAVMISYTVAGLGCALAAFCYAEFAATVPVAGSAYTYGYATLGELFAWIIGWDLLLEYAMSCAVVAADWTKYFNEFIKLFYKEGFNPIWMNSTLTYSDADGWGWAWQMNLPAVIVMVLCTIVLVVGIRESAGTNALLVGIKVVVVLFVIIVGAFYIWNYIEPNYWTQVPKPAVPGEGGDPSKWGLLGTLGVNRLLADANESTRSNFMPFGFSGVMVGAALVFFAYIGFDSISTHAEEARKPQRDVPFGIIASLAICTLLYFGVAAVITRLEPYPEIDPDAAIAAAFRKLGERNDSWLLHAAAGFIAVGALAGITSVLLITFLSQARIFLAMARDGLLPKRVFGSVHPRFRTPHVSTILMGGVVSVVAAITPISILEEMVSIGTAMAFIVVCAAVLLLRVRRPDVPRPFRCPAVYLVAPLGIIVNLGMMMFLSPRTWERLLYWLIIGLVIYFLYGRRHSVIGKQLRGETA
jgi:APA family basic amino acid/polyamine antiporter